jgi:hypothetical protein
MERPLKHVRDLKLPELVFFDVDEKLGESRRDSPEGAGGRFRP